MQDGMTGFLTESGHFRVVVAWTTGMGNEIRERHRCSFRVTDAMSRFVTGSVLLASNLKGGDTLGVYLSCAGPVQGLRAEVNALGHVKAFPLDPSAGVDEVDSHYVMDLDQLIVQGQLTVTRVLEKGKRPVSGTVEVFGGSLAIGFSRYLLQSEQIHSAMLFGNFLEPEGRVRFSGGMLVQALPGASDQDRERMEAELASLPPFHEVLAEAETADQVVGLTLPDWGLSRVFVRELQFRCSCSREKVKAVLMSLAEEERRSALGEDGCYTVRCEYCGVSYCIPPMEMETSHE